MTQYQSVFCRKEVKYLLSESQHAALQRVLAEKTVPDAFPVSAISNLYYDTSNFRLIRASIAKPSYKEKLRLRCYQTPDINTQAFVEIKKKVSGIVYKRRTSLPYGRALSYLAGKAPGGDSQIFHELDWFLRFYSDLEPAMVLCYDRLSMRGREDPMLRLTVDKNIRWRREDLDLTEGSWGRQLLRPGQRLLEVKAPGAIPLWLAKTFSALEIYPVSFSKYGAAYKQMLADRQCKEGEKRYA